MASNVDILTKSHTVLKAKARAKKGQIESVVFDDDARREFLTGFRKRKLQKKEAAKSKAKERERQERLQARKEMRQQLKEQAEKNARMVEGAFGNEDYGSDDEFSGISDLDKGKEKATQEYEDEEQLATVTVVEEFDPDTLRHPTALSRSSPPPSNDLRKDSSNPKEHTSSTKPKKAVKKTKAESKKIAYETKAARKVARVKQRARKFEKAELAGGKASRKYKNSKNKRRS
ncbi:required for cell viability rrp17 [Pyrrhoderma noxium]|uniref:Required for cell viability rrp17 n=1 Tax=Pyrrhoderma noxium TaxID=2282107 RepID=A0A286UGH5_9AGAM|nr:required for cell viability rrp17 [Pyrrhoderma noxium]